MPLTLRLAHKFSYVASSSKRERKMKGLCSFYPTPFDLPRPSLICDFLLHNFSCEHPIGTFNHRIHCHLLFSALSLQSFCTVTSLLLCVLKYRQLEEPYNLIYKQQGISISVEWITMHVYACDPFSWHTPQPQLFNLYFL